MGFDVWGGGATLADYLASCHSSAKYARGYWYVLCVDGEVVSSALAHDFPDWGAHVIRGIGSLATVPGRRKEGFAGALLEALTATLAGAEKASIIFLFSDIGSAFYAKRGYVVLEPRHQSHAGSVTMAWLKPGLSVDILDENAAHHPSYF